MNGSSINENKRSLILAILGTGLDVETKRYLTRLVNRDTPQRIGYYTGSINGESRRLIRCSQCGRNLRPINERRREENNRFCPACGQRIKWS